MIEPEKEVKIVDPWQQDFKIKIKQDLRAQAAIAAMQGLISDYERITDYAKSELIMTEGIEKSIAIQSVGYADALLKELEK